MGQRQSVIYDFILEELRRLSLSKYVLVLCYELIYEIVIFHSINRETDKIRQVNNNSIKMEICPSVKKISTMILKHHFSVKIFLFWTSPTWQIYECWWR